MKHSNPPHLRPLEQFLAALGLTVIPVLDFDPVRRALLRYPIPRVLPLGDDAHIRVSSCRDAISSLLNSKKTRDPLVETKVFKRGSDLGPKPPQYPSKWHIMSQNQARRTNKITRVKLIRDQGVGGSNPLAPTKQSSLVSVRYSDGAGVCYFGLESS